MRHVSLCLVTLFVFAACNLSGPDDPLAGFGPRGQMRVTVQTVGPVPAVPYCVEVEIHEPTRNERGWPVPNIQPAGLGPNESKVFESQVGERTVILKRAPLTKNGSCAPSPDDLIPDCMIDGEVEAQRALGKWGTVLKRIMVREGRTTEASFTVRCT